jgi:hypothetical protein
MNKDRIGSALLFLFGGTMAWGSIGLSIGNFWEPGAGLFPLLISLGLCAASALNWLKPRHDQKVEWGGFLTKMNMTPWKITLLSIIFVLSMETIGYLTIAVLYLLSLFLWVCRYSWSRSLLLTASIAPLSWLFFARVLSLQLPIGPWGF